MALIETIALLHRSLPKEFIGFDFVAERPGDRGGFIVTVDWIGRRDPEPGPGGASISQDGWSRQTSITLEGEGLEASSGSGTLQSWTQPSEYDSEKRALIKAFAAEWNQSISICFSSRRTKD